MEGQTIDLHSHELYTHTAAPINDVANLLQLTGRQAKQAISKTSPKTALVYFLELFRGNGWNVSLTYRGAGGALLLSYPKSPHSVALIVKFSTAASQLTYEEARKELVDFENNLSSQYKCYQFAIISLNGIAPAAESLEKFNLLLQDWSYVDDLIKSYRTATIKEPRIQLFAHNKQTYKKVRSLMKSTRAIAVVQATGTGKSFLIARLLQDFAGEKRLVMAPSIYVIEQVKEHIGDEASVEYMTYARSMNLSQSEIAALCPKLIVLDEFHRCGAEEWGRGVENILNAWPNAYRLGTSATPVRYLDNARDMSHELFNNNVAENLSLAQAIVRNILPMPKYVCAIYTLSEERDILREKINKSRFPNTVKKQMQLDLDAATIDWERSHGISAVLGKYLQPHMKKFIVFCKDEAHLLEMEPVVTGWFKSATNVANIQAYRIYDGEPKSDDNLKAFKLADTATGIYLLFSINMLNEGLHVNEVSGVVLLRPTESPNIFYQQIGRCLKVGLSYSPVIFDFVNNFRSIRTHDFLYDLEFERSQFAAGRISENLEDRCPAFTITDEVREITEIFGEIKFKLDSWEAQFQRLVEYKELFGDCNVTIVREGNTYQPLWHWLNVQRNKFKRDLLEPARRDKLVALGFDWKLDQLTGSRDEGWEKHFQQLCEFREKYGHCNVNDSHTSFVKLNGFVRDQRYRYGIKTLQEYRINKLNSIGFEFVRDFKEGKWQVQFDKLVAYKNERGHFRIDGSVASNRKLGQWVTSQKMHFRANKLDKARQQKLNSIGFEWTESNAGAFEKNFSQLVAYYQKHQHCQFAVKSKLHYFANNLRVKYREKRLSAEHIQQLQAMNFNLEFKQNNATVKYRRLEQLEEFFRLHGHSNITSQNENYPGLYGWVCQQRKGYTKNLLPQEIIKRMEACGFIWKSKQYELDTLWNKQYDALLKIFQKTGTTTFQRNKSNKALHNWCSSQRAKYKRNELLTEEQIEKLNAIGFTWEILEPKWEEHFAQLVAFKAQNEHCNVPQLMPQTRELGIWCSNMRKAYKTGKMPDEKIKRFEALGFAWDMFKTMWQTSYETLQKHLKKYGWAKFSKDKVLNEWLNKQRQNYKTNSLSQEKIMLLNMAEIIWEPEEYAWHTMFGKFVEYRQTFGSSTVCYSDKSYASLYSWCFTQRKNYRENKMPEDKFTLLNNAGFQWNLKER